MSLKLTMPLQDDWAVTNAIEAGERGSRAPADRLDARSGRPAGEDPRPARMARADEVPGARAWRSACSCRGAVPDRPRPQALRGRAPGAARASGGRVVYGKG